jgi:hypothetical protein
VIETRPASLLADPAYGILPKLPLALDWSSVPELIRVATLDLGGIQPVTKAMAEAAGGTLRHKPSYGEVELFRKRGTTFQLVSLVLSCVLAGEVDGVLQVRPFAMTLIPASKRDKVQDATIDLVANLDVNAWLATEPMYAGYDPFSGGWSLFGNLPGYMDGERKGYLDEMGLVVDQFFLATKLADDDEVLTMDIKMPSEQMKARYEKHRRKLFFTPFKQVEARRVWGAEAFVEGANCNQVLLSAAHDDLAKAQAPLFLQRGVNDPIAFFGKFIFRHDVIGPLEITGIGILEPDEFAQVERFLSSLMASSSSGSRVM